jgi:flavin-binding protein dodecin
MRKRRYGAGFARSVPSFFQIFIEKELTMSDSVYKVIELIGTSKDSWEKAAANAIARASKSLRDLRIAEVVQLDMHVEDGQITLYRAKLKVSFKYHGDED